MIFAKIFIAATCRKKNQIRQNLCDLLQRQNSVAEKIFHQKIFCTHEATCPCDASPQLVGTTTRPTCTQSDLSPRLVAATHRLVCFDLYALLGPVYIEGGNPPHVTSLTWGTPPSCKQAFTDQGSWNFLFLVCKHVSGRPCWWQYNKQFFEEFTWKQFFIPRCPPWRHVQTSNTILKVTWNHCFTRR